MWLCGHDARTHVCSQVAGHHWKAIERNGVGATEYRHRHRPRMPWRTQIVNVLVNGDRSNCLYWLDCYAIACHLLAARLNAIVLCSRPAESGKLIFFFLLHLCVFHLAHPTHFVGSNCSAKAGVPYAQYTNTRFANMWHIKILFMLNVRLFASLFLCGFCKSTFAILLFVRELTGLTDYIPLPFCYCCAFRTPDTFLCELPWAAVAWNTQTIVNYKWDVYTRTRAHILCNNLT